MPQIAGEQARALEVTTSTLPVSRGIRARLRMRTSIEQQCPGTLGIGTSPGSSSIGKKFLRLGSVKQCRGKQHAALSKRRAFSDSFLQPGLDSWTDRRNFFGRTQSIFRLRPIQGRNEIGAGFLR